MFDSFLFDFQGVMLRLALVSMSCVAGFWVLRLLVQAVVRDGFLAGVIVLVLGAGASFLFPDLGGKIVAIVCGSCAAGPTARSIFDLPDFRQIFR